MQETFTKFAKLVSHFSGRMSATIIAFLIVISWVIGGFIVGFSSDYQMYINTGTTIITFLMVFLIQNTQNRDSEAMQVKLDEIIRSIKGAGNEFLDLENLDESELDEIREKYLKLAKEARIEIEKKAQPAK